MIITKTPLRISFVGGGSDIEMYYKGSYGHVISAAIDKYIYVFLNKKFDNKIRVIYSEIEEVDHVDDIRHPIVREVLKYFSVGPGLEIISIADIPSAGSGLGSSSAFTVGLVKAINKYLGNPLNANQAAKIAVDIEINKCKEPIGKQDQYACAYGGINSIKFLSSGDVIVDPIKKINNGLNDAILLIYTGKTRLASHILSQQVENMEKDETYIEYISKIVDISNNFLKNIDGDLKYLGYLLSESWEIKKKMAKLITSEEIDAIYNIGMSNGAYGGKLLGAGGGGFILFIAPINKHDLIRKKLNSYKSLSVKMIGYPANMEF